ncbi:MAG: carbohydrate-binding protein [Lachnospiraceae bacterium]|nr:carbohydrate-binding protein [Lachnospiraceae bacterium]
MFSIKVLNETGMTKFVAHGEEEVYLVATSEYEPGDRVVLEYSGEPTHVWFQADDAMGASLLYITGNVEVKIPFGEQRTATSHKAFIGNCHYLYVKAATELEVKQYRNHAINVYDSHENTTSFPHASANVETRNEAVFAARNAIDGIKANSSHGEWPYDSWGINRDPKACLKVDFGEEIVTDQVVLYLRADFPHDNWWKEVTLEFSDGSKVVAQLEKTGRAQKITFPEKTVTYVELKDLIKAESESPFPALTQIEVYGTIR